MAEADPTGGAARLGVLPLGTVNVFAREMNIPLRLADAWALLQSGQEQCIDLPQADFSEGATLRTRHFIQLAGAGLDSRAISLVHYPLKKAVGPLAYVAAGLRALSERQPRIRVKIGGREAEGELALVGNGRFYGGRFLCFPQASLQDGELDVCLFPSVTMLRAVRAGVGLVLSQLEKLAGTIHLRGPSVQISSVEPVAFELDGENVGQLPVTLTIQRRLRVIASVGNRR